MYRIGDRTVSPDDPDFDKLLKQARPERVRPLCLCRSGGVEMVIARLSHSGVHILKRMPGTGPAHAPCCESYDPPPGISGLSPLLGNAIVEDREREVTHLKFSFPLSRSAERAAPGAATAEAEPEAATGAHPKLTLRALFDYLLHEAELTRWYPSFEGKRSWAMVHRRLAAAAQGKIAKRLPLSRVLFIPEPFSIDHRQEIASRRMAFLAQGPPGRRFFVLVAEAKNTVESPHGGRLLVCKHLPDFHFQINPTLYRRMVKVYESEIALWKQDLPGCRLATVAVFSVNEAGVASLEEISLVCLNEGWIPFRSLYEKALLDSLKERSYVRALRFCVPGSTPLAFATLTDTRPQPTVLYLIPPGSSDEYAARAETIAGATGLPFWIWNAAQEMPPLPEQAA